VFYIHTAVGCAVVGDYVKKQKIQAEYDLHLWDRKNSLLHQKLDYPDCAGSRQSLIRALESISNSYLI